MTQFDPIQPPPPAPPPPPPGMPSEELRNIASMQKGILICILLYIVALVLQFALVPAMRPLLGLVILAVGIYAAVLIFKLAMKLYGTGVGVVLGILTLIPLVGLIVLLIVNSKATDILKKNGIEVGLLGAKMKL